MGVKILKFADERYAEERREADERYAEERREADERYAEERREADERYAEERREADKRYAEREQKAREESHRQGVEQERERVAESLRSRGFDESTIDEVLSFDKDDEASTARQA